MAVSKWFLELDKLVFTGGVDYFFLLTSLGLQVPRKVGEGDKDFVMPSLGQLPDVSAL